MSNNTPNIIAINKGLYASIGFVLLIAAGAFLIANGKENIGYVILGAALLCSFIFLLFFIPQAQRLEISDKAVTFYGYKHCRPYFWSQIIAIELNEESVIIKIDQSDIKKQDKNEPYFKINVKAETYGYTPKELYELLNNKLIELELLSSH